MRRGVAHADFLALIDEKGPAEGCLHQRQQLGALVPHTIAVVRIPRNTPRIVMILDKDRIPPVPLDHAPLPPRDDGLHLFDIPRLQCHTYVGVIDVHEVEDEDHVEFAGVGANGAQNLVFV